MYYVRRTCAVRDVTLAGDWLPVLRSTLYTVFDNQKWVWFIFSSVGIYIKRTPQRSCDRTEAHASSCWWGYSLMHLFFLISSIVLLVNPLLCSVISLTVDFGGHYASFAPAPICCCRRPSGVRLSVSHYLVLFPHLNRITPTNRIEATPQSLYFMKLTVYFIIIILIFCILWIGTSFSIGCILQP